jgi:hypothetical protein
MSQERRTTADPSISQAAKCASCSAQDDSMFVAAPAVAHPTQSRGKAARLNGAPKWARELMA